MIRLLIIVLCAGYVISAATNNTGKIGAIIDKICAKRALSAAKKTDAAVAAAGARIEREKVEKTGDMEDEEDDNRSEDKTSNSNNNINLNKNSNRKMYYDNYRRLMGDESAESSIEGSNSNSNTNINIKHRNRTGYSRRFAFDDPNNTDIKQRLMYGLRRKL